MLKENQEKLLSVNLFFIAMFGMYLLLARIFSALLKFYTIIPIALFVLFLAPVLFVSYLKFNIKNIFKIRGISFKTILLVIAGSILVLFLSQFIAGIGVRIFELTGKKVTPQVTLEKGIVLIIIQFLITSVLVPISEETFFRGFLLGVYEKLNIKYAPVITGVLFGLYHLQFHIVLGTIFAGIMWGYFVKYTRSLLSGIIAHVIFNGTTLLIMYNKSKFGKVFTRKVKQISFIDILTLLIIVLILSTLLYVIIKKFKRSYDKFDNEIENDNNNDETITDLGVEKNEVFNKVKPWLPIAFFVFLILMTTVSMFFGN